MQYSLLWNSPCTSFPEIPLLLRSLKRHTGVIDGNSPADQRHSSTGGGAFSPGGIRGGLATALRWHRAGAVGKALERLGCGAGLFGTIPGRGTRFSRGASA